VLLRPGDTLELFVSVLEPEMKKEILDNKIIFLWVDSKEKAIKMAWKYFKSILRIFIIMLPLIVILFLWFYTELKTIFPEEPWENFFIKGGYALLMVMGMFLVSPIMFFLDRNVYQITEEKLTFKTRKYLWNKFRGFKIMTPDDTNEKLISLVQLKKNNFNITLPPGEPGEKILVWLETKLPRLDQDQTEITKISKLCHGWLIILTIIYTLGLAIFFIREPSGNLFCICNVFLVLFGPGTLGLLMWFKKNFFKEKYLKAIAVLYNMSSWTLFMVFLLIFALKHTLDMAQMAGS